MREARPRRTRRVVGRLFLSILLLVSLAVAGVTLATFSLVESVVTSQLHARALERLRRARSAFDMIHGSTVPAAVQLFEQRDIQRLTYSRGLSPFEVYQIGTVLNQAKLSNPALHSIVVYNYQEALIHSTELGTVPVDRYDDRDLIERMRHVSASDMFQYLPRIVAGENLLTLIIGVQPFADGSELRGALVTNVSERRLRALLSPDDNAGVAQLVIIDEDDRVLSHPEPTLFRTPVSRTPLGPALDEIVGSYGVVQVMVDDVEHAVSYLRDPSRDWHFLLVTPVAALLSPLHILRNSVLLVVLLGTFIAAGVAWIVAHRIARPISALAVLTHHIESQIRSDPPDSRVTDEIAYMDRVLTLADRRLTEMDRISSRATTRYRSDLLRSLLERHVDPADVRDDLIQVAPTVGTDHRFVVAVLRLDMRNLALLSVSEQAEIRSWAAETFRGGCQHTAEPVEMAGDETAMVIHSDEAAADLLGAARSAALALIEEAFESRGVSVTVGLSYVVDDLGHLAAGYRDARDATNNRFRDGVRTVIEASDERPASVEYRFPERAIDGMLKHVVAGNVDAARDVLNEVLEEVLAHGYEDFVLLTQLTLHHTYRRLRMLDLLDESELDELRRIRGDTRSMVTPDDLRGVLVSLFEMVRTSLESQRSVRHQKLVREAHRLIESHYTDKNLSATSISEMLGLSTNHVRRVFKELTGVSLASALNEFRITRCADQLLATDEPIVNIYQELGFSSYNYFFALFRQRYGVTPQQFRRNSRSRDGAMADNAGKTQKN